MITFQKKIPLAAAFIIISSLLYVGNSLAETNNYWNIDEDNYSQESKKKILNIIIKKESLKLN